MSLVWLPDLSGINTTRPRVILATFEGIPATYFGHNRHSCTVFHYVVDYSFFSFGLNR